jgi:signal transduction histidine kinase
LEQEGLVGALKRRLDAVEKKVGVKARVVMEQFIELPPPVEEELYWIAQEALNNSLKHAKAAKEVVRIYVQDNATVLEISDDGKGFDPESASQHGGMGLVNMRERVKHIGGTLTIRSKIGKGTVIKASVPLPEARANGI